MKLKLSGCERHYRDIAPPINGLQFQFSNKTKLEIAKGKIQLNCNWCGLLYETYACWAKRQSRHYCSRSCTGLGKRNQSPAKCVACGKNFLAENYSREMKDRITCSPECLHQRKKELFLENDSAIAKKLNGLSIPIKKSMPPQKYDPSKYSKITEAQAKEIIQSDDGNAILSERYGLSKEAIRLIRIRRTWRNVSI